MKQSQLKSLFTFSVTIVLIIAPIFIGVAYAQERNPTKAAQLAEEANKLVKYGKYESAVTRLQQAIKLDPDNYKYPLDLSKVHFMHNNFPLAITYGNQALGKKDADEEAYIYVGHMQNKAGNVDKAKKIYERGLEKFPNSGALHHDLGAHYANYEGSIAMAIGYWEKGIELAPEFSMNYYEATKYYADTDTKIWALMYGEQFMNLERMSPLTLEISQLLYRTYKGAINIEAAPSERFKISKTPWARKPDGSIDTLQLAFPNLYEITMNEAINEYLANTKKPEVNLDMIVYAWNRFIETWYDRNYERIYRNPLFQWQNSLNDQSFMEAYHYWILVNGDRESSEKWMKKNKKTNEEFLSWFKDNPMTVSRSNALHREYFSGKTPPPAPDKLEEKPAEKEQPKKQPEKKKEEEPKELEDFRKQFGG